MPMYTVHIYSKYIYSMYIYIVYIYIYICVYIVFCVTANKTYVLFWTLYYAIFVQNRKFTSKMKHCYKCGCGSHVYQVLCE